MKELTGEVLKQAYRVHSELGSGLLESTYEECLVYCLKAQGLKIEQQKAIPLIFENINLPIGYRADIVVNNFLLLEIKSVEELKDVHFAQTLTYLKLGQYKLGLLINFNTVHLKDGIRRIINT